MYSIKLIVVLTIGIFALSVASCRTSRPESLAGWDGCLARDHRLERQSGGQIPSLEVVPGTEGVVLYLRAHWDKSLFSKDYSWGSLLLMLNRDLQPGLTITLDGKHHGMYWEGGQELVFDTVDVVGTVDVLEMDDEEMVLLLDLVARGERKTVDDEQHLKREMVTQELKGKVRAELVDKMKQCKAP